MNTPTAETYLPPLGHHQHDEVGRELQAALVELIDLSLIGKQLHWSVSGPLFRSLHLQLDELVESWPDLADTVAERAVTIGFWPDGQARAVAEGSELTGLEPGPVQDHMFLLADRFGTGTVFAGFRPPGSHNEARAVLQPSPELRAEQDVLTGLLGALEEQQWM